MEKNSKIFIVGDKSILGTSLIHFFKSNGFYNVLSESMRNIDLLDQKSVSSFFRKEKPEYVFLTYLKSGGIIANIKYSAEFIYDNLQIQNNVIHYSFKFGVKKLLFLGSSCIYPRDCPQPIKEEYLLSGRLENTSESYAISKIAGIKMCQAYSQQYRLNCISLIPATIYGPNDDFKLETGHVIPSLIRKFHRAKINNEKKAIVWGTGEPRREFIYVDDVIDASIFLMTNYSSSEIINVGCGDDILIKELAQFIKVIIGFKGNIVFDESKPDGVLRKLLDNSKIADLGWKAKIGLEEGIRRTYEWYKEHFKQLN